MKDNKTARTTACPGAKSAILLFSLNRMHVLHWLKDNQTALSSAVVAIVFNACMFSLSCNCVLTVVKYTDMLCCYVITFASDCVSGGKVCYPQLPCFLDKSYIIMCSTG